MDADPPHLRAAHPQIRALLEAAAAESEEPGPADIAAERAAYLDTTLRLGGAAEPVADVAELVIPSGEARLPAALYVPLHASETTGLLVWLHGGGWYVGDIATFDRVGRSLANASGLKVLMPEYRLAPEHRWPVQIEDADAVVGWSRSEAGAHQLAIDPSRVVVGGDSAGGQLAAVAVRHARDDGGLPVRAQLLVYPELDPALDSPACTEFRDGPMLTLADMRRCWGFYLDGGDPRHPDVAPLCAGDLQGLPPAWVAVAGLDPLRDDGLRYADALRGAGVATHVRRFDDMVHGFLRWAGVVDRARELVDWLGDAARDAAAER